jgi:hypothetical protein
MWNLSTPSAPSDDEIAALSQLVEYNRKRKAAERRQRRMTWLWVLVSAIAILAALAGWL